MKCASFVLSVLAITSGARAAHAVCVGGAPDGSVAPSENCDDGNNVNGDGCSNQCTIVGENSCARAVSFANLDVEDFPGSTATWAIASDDLSGVQGANTPNPTVALFGEDAAKGSYVVRMEVLAPVTFNDDDYIGLAIGFNPGDASNPNANYLVVDWKQAAQGGAQEGLRLVHVRGIVNNGTHNNHQIALRQCPNATTSCAKEIAQGRRFATTGWSDQTPVEAIITYRPDHLEIRIDNILELDVRPSDFPGEFPGNVFPTGQIGFYLLSQEAVEYTNLAPFGPSVCNLTSLTPGIFPRLIGSATTVINTAGQLVEGGDQLDPASVVIKSVTGGTATIAGNGNITFTPTNPAIAGSYPITVFACDNDPVIPDCDEAVFTVVYAPDRDGDGVLDPTDLDDDDDGIPDRLETTLGIDPDADADNDGIPNFRDKTNRGDGQPSSCVDTAAPIGTCDAPGVEFDRDRDGVPNHLDLDSDNDGLLDVVEVFGNLPDANKNGRLDCAGGVGTNGLCNAFEVVADNGVIDFNNDDVGPDAALDSDLDGLPDFLDLDADGDGIADLIEGNSGCTDTTPADARCDGADGDGDGVVNQRDTANGHGVGTYNDCPDTDADGTPDLREIDSDGDTIRDLIEANSGCLDANTNGVCDNQDAANDGLANDAAATRPDTDNDGRPDFRDLDSDGDGVRDSVEGVVDTDGDGRVDFRDLDSDNDGIADVVEGSSGCADTTPRNGRCDGTDANGDGLADTATNATPPDTDGDGAVDFRDLDSDNDGITDVTEGGSGCTDTTPANAVCDGPDGNGDGLVNSATLVATPDSDGDGTVDFRDLDSDDDGPPPPARRRRRRQRLPRRRRQRGVRRSRR
jgi:cysteine-rich repeat protein